MGDALLGFGIFMGVLFVVFVVSCAWALHWLRRRNQVSLRYPTHPPLRWMVAPGRCARLHRRLQSSVVVLRAAVPRPAKRRRRTSIAPLAAAAEDLEVHAAALDRDLVLAARLRGVVGSQLRDRLAGQVSDMERVVARVAAAATAASPLRPGATPTPEALADLDEQLDALESARDELARLEAGVGLRPSI
jgi:hypothetical protein